ncbi:uncharacterized protein [Lolium perenne]|uniref:uncharacterized protein isoform X2 n=1 Tax=Lolium perenne TaxID=4522 RepID=UPI003A990ADC
MFLTLTMRNLRRSIRTLHLHHKNVVRLVSYCNETKGEYVQFNGKLVVAEKIWRVLCFEYMCKGSLDKFIFDEANERNWSTRYAIINGICQGLEYLHEKLNPPMYHLDLKPANILLDESMSPKIADFGLSRLFIEQRTKQTNSSLGTRGYIPPEYIDAGLISIKFDIFSLGVVIIKMMTGQDGYFRPAEISSQQFADDVHTDWMNRLQGMSMNVYSIQVRRCIEIALSCVEAGRHKRPSIGVIIQNLCRTESIIQILDALRNSWTSQADICPCISNETEMLDILENNMKSYPLRVTDNRGRVHQATITTIGDPACDTSTSEIIDCTGDLGYSQKWEENFGYVCTVDVHPTEPWILVGHYSGHVSAWNHRTQKILMGLRIVNTGERTISAVRFIPHKQWFVAGDSNGHIHVCITAPDNVKKFQAHASCINSLAVHPIDPFVLSSSDDHLIKLWNWENEECIRTFQAHSKEVESVKFNPLTTSNTFASASRDGTIKIWSIHSGTPITTLECEAELTSVHYLSLPGSHQHIVTGSSCGTARIWDLEEETCIQNINGLQNGALLLLSIAFRDIRFLLQFRKITLFLAATPVPTDTRIWLTLNWDLLWILPTSRTHKASSSQVNAELHC